MADAGRGDAAAFADLVDRHQAAAWRLARRMIGDPSEAEDIVQAAFLKLLQAAPTYRATARFTTFLHCVVGRLCLDRLRRRRPEPLADGCEPLSSGPDPQIALVHAERERALWRAVADLPAQQRLAVILRHQAGLSYAEIARVMATSVRSVEGCLARARRTLQDRLREWG